MRKLLKEIPLMGPSSISLGGKPIECVAMSMQPSSLKESSTMVTQNKILIRDILVSIQIRDILVFIQESSAWLQKCVVEKSKIDPINGIHQQVEKSVCLRLFLSMGVWGKLLCCLCYPFSLFCVHHRLRWCLSFLFFGTHSQHFVSTIIGNA